MRTNRKPHNKRLSLRVTALDLESWRFYAAELYTEPLSALIRRAVNEYVVDPPPSSELSDLKFSVLAEMAAFINATIDRPGLRKMTLCDKTIVLRVSRDDYRRWKVAAHQEDRSVSAMIRRAVRRYLYPIGSGDFV